MRKQLAIGASVLALAAFGGVSENSVLLNQGVTHQYTHLIETSQSQNFEPLSRASLDVGLPNRLNFKTASVSFITGSDGLTFDFPEFIDDSPDKCKQLGYTKTSCTSGNPTTFCPYNNTYFKECCDAKYKYSKEECTYPKTVSGDSCGGKYMCYCDRSLYPVEKCQSPQVTDGTSCIEDGKIYYGGCVCPSQYSQTCDGLNQQGSGEGCTQNGVTKYTNCQCKSGYNMTCSDLGPVTPSDYCLLNGVKYYNNCKTCENKCKLSSCPAGNICEYEDCSQKYCDIGCAIDYVNWCKKPETNCATLGYTQTTNECPNGYLKCPYDEAAVFCDDNSSPCVVGSVLGNDQKCYDVVNLPASIKPVGIVFDVVNSFALALTDTKQDGSAGSEDMYWTSEPSCEIPNLENCSHDSIESCGVDGRANTDVILATTCAGGITYVANAIKGYQTSNCSADFCQKGKWFLPSVKDLRRIYALKGIINYSLASLVSKGASTLQKDYYWTSTGNSSRTYFISLNKGNWRVDQTPRWNCYVRLIVKY